MAIVNIVRSSTDAPFFGTFTEKTSTQFKIVSGNDDVYATWIFSGVGFTYSSAGEPTGGAINSFELHLSTSGLLYSVTGVNVYAGAFLSARKSTRESMLNNLWYAESDTITGGINPDTLKGYGGADYLDGGAGQDTLIGSDDSAIDTLVGGLGGDQYRIGGFGHASNDLIVELPDGGKDQVYSLTSYTLPANVEDLIMDGNTGPANLVGNELANMMMGNVSANLLDGLAGDDTLYSSGGLDTMRGGTGNDLYVLTGNEPTTPVIELPGEGIDTVHAYYSYTLQAEVERLELQSNGHAEGHGNTLNNELLGNVGNNLLDGAAGSDTLRGGAGNDTVDGGDGFDLCSFSGNRGEFALTKVGGGVLVADGVAGRDGSDIVRNVEILRFADRSVDLSMAAHLDGVSAQNVKTLEELYVGFFNRVPEASGLAYWLDQLKEGTSLETIADLFYDAGVAFGVYSSSMTSQEFIREIYKNVLGRPPGIPPTVSEVEYWNDRLASGEDSKGTMVLQMLADVHSDFERITDTAHPNYPYQFVAAHLNNKAAVAHYYAVEQGLSLNAEVDNITFGVQLASLITPEDFDAAIGMIGLSEFSVL